MRDEREKDEKGGGRERRMRRGRRKTITVGYLLQ